MTDIVERLRDYRGCDVSVWKAMEEAADEIKRLRRTSDAAKENRDNLLKAMIAKDAENGKLRAALDTVMVGGNHLATIIGADHPPQGSYYCDVLAHYGPGHRYDAWCCWNSIMLARAALQQEVK